MSGGCSGGGPEKRKKVANECWLAGWTLEAWPWKRRQKAAKEWWL